MLEAEDEGSKTVSFVFTDGETLTFRVGGDQFAGNKIFNGGLHEVGMLLASLAASGIVGSAAYDAVKLGARFLRLRLRWGTEVDQRPYIRHIAHLSVAAKLGEPSSIKVVSCVRQAECWVAVVVADGRTYRVQIPLDDPRPTAISVDLD
jgi:hypothetical protein